MTLMGRTSRPVSEPDASSGHPQVRVAVVLSTVLGVGCASPGPAVIEQGPPMTEELARDALVDAKQLTEAGVTAGDVEGLLAARDRLRELAGQRVVATSALYHVGYVDTVLASILVDRDQGRPRQVIDHGIAHLKAALELDPKSADALMVMSTLYLQRMEVDTLSAVGSHGESRRSMERALALEPENPRVVMLVGVRLLYLPDWLGGDVALALERLEEASRLFSEAKPEGPLAPDWGQADALMWAGAALLRLDEYDRAEAALRAALELRPGYWRVTDWLLPRLERQRSR
jgi:tetratricopeptide (TPR) repeat protein